MKRILGLLLAVVLLVGCTPQKTDPTVEQTTGAILQETTEGTTEETTEASEIPPSLTVHFLDVQHADSIFLACEGEYALVDAGYPESGDKVISYLREQGVEELDLVVGTHPHGDHIGGIPSVLKAIPTQTVWSSQLPYVNDYVRNFTDAATSTGAELCYPRPGEQFQLGGATIDVIGPLNLEYEDANDLSLVLMVTYGDTRFLLTGDMEELAERELLDAGVDLKADVLKVGHHGSYSSTCYRFLREVAPSFGVISLGANNEYGHPHSAPLSRLQDADVTILRTDHLYDIVAYSDGETVSFSWGNTYALPWLPGDPR